MPGMSLAKSRVLLKSQRQAFFCCVPREHCPKALELAAGDVLGGREVRLSLHTAQAQQGTGTAQAQRVVRSNSRWI